MKKTLLSLAFLSLGVMTQAQVKIGNNHNTINANSLLELESTDKGILFPRMALTATDNASPLTAHVQGMTVFNTATAGTGDNAVSPGIYYNSGTEWVALLSQAENPVGTIVAKASINVPTGYLYCDGQSLDTTTYNSLFQDIGYTYGGSGANFNLPDYRGQFLRGQDDGAGTDPDASSRTGGDAVGSSQTDAFQGHHHVTRSLSVTTGAAGSTNVRTGDGASNGTNLVGNPESDGTNGTPRTSSETRPVNIAVRYYIKF